MLPTCVVNSVPHLKTTDGAGFVFIVSFEDQLETHEEMHSQMSVEREQRLSGCYCGPYLPLLDLFPQVFELLQV